MKILKQSISDLVKTDFRLWGKLVTLFNVHPNTIARWASVGANDLLTPSALEVIAIHCKANEIENINEISDLLTTKSIENEKQTEIIQENSQFDTK